MPVSKDFLPIAGASGQGDTTYAINQSIRFDDDKNNYLSKTPSAASDGGKTYTYSFWIKRNTLAKGEYIIHAGSSYAGLNPGDYIYFDNTDYFRSWHGTNTLISNRTFKDVSAWYHFVYIYDSTQAISTERVRFYVNGVRETSFSTAAYPSLNATSYFNTNTTHYIGGANSSASRLTSYLAEIHFLDGYAYGPEYFGEFKEDTDIWTPIEYTGSYGTNGFKIDGRDSSDLGDDESGNGNDYASTNFSADDQVLDSPTNNFSVMNPLANYYVQHTYANGNLEETTSTSSSYYSYSINNIGMSSGKWYVEVLFSGSATAQMLVGISDREGQGGTHYLGSQSYEYSYYNLNGKSINGGTQSSYGNTFTQNDIIGIALDLDNSKLYFSKNGTFQNSGVPTSGSTGTGAISITAVGSTQNGFYFFGAGDYSSSYATTYIWNFGQEGTFSGNVSAGNNKDSRGIGNFKYSVPSGYLALCTKNLGS